MTDKEITYKIAAGLRVLAEHDVTPKALVYVGDFEDGHFIDTDEKICNLTVFAAGFEIIVPWDTTGINCPYIPVYAGCGEYAEASFEFAEAYSETEPYE